MNFNAYEVESGSVQRKVLSIPTENTYITIEPEQTAESDTNSLKQKYIRMMVLSGGYMLVFVVVWIFCKQREKTEHSEMTE